MTFEKNTARSSNGTVARRALLACVSLLSLLAASPMRADDRAVVRRAPVVYPPLARQMHATGTVLVTVTISPAGDVLNAGSTSPYKLLVPAAVDAVKQWKFAPGSAVSTAVIQIKFGGEDR